jgi:hypothetical protein
VGIIQRGCECHVCMGALYACAADQGTVALWMDTLSGCGG